MTAREFIEAMRLRGVCFFAQGGRLLWFAPSRPAAAALAQASALKLELLSLVEEPMLERLCAMADPEEAAYLREERAAILEHEAGMSRKEAECRAGLAVHWRRSSCAG